MQINNKINTYVKKKNPWHGLTLTKSAACQIKKLTKVYPGMIGLRIGIKKSGCAGFSYKFIKVVQKKSDDWIFEYEDAKLYISLNSLPFLDGIEVDYIKQGLNYIFKINNPKAKHTCGCGESFSL